MMATDDRDVQDAAEVPPRDPANVEAEDDQPMALPVMPMIAVGFPPVIGAASAAAGGLARPTEGIAPLAAGAAAYGAVGPLPLHGGSEGATAERFESALAADGRLGPGTANSVRFDLEEGGIAVLSGSVPSERERETAEAIAREVEGVRRVDNQLTVG